MWRVISRRADEPAVNALLAQTSGRPVDQLALSELFASVVGSGGAIPDTLAAEYELAGGWRTSPLYAIDVWGSEAAEAAPDRLRMRDGVLVWTPGGQETNRPVRAVWHERTVMLADARPGSDLEIEYGPDDGDRERTDRVRAETGRGRPPCAPDPLDGRILDWRLYLGANTIVGSGLTRLRRQGGKLVAWVRVPTRAGEAGGVLVGKIVLIDGPPGGILATDNFWERRVAGEERDRPGVARKSTRLAATAPATRHEAVTVYVHGTLSTTLAALEILDHARCLTEPTFRYEHDTFRGLRHSAAELSELIHTWFGRGPDGWPRVRLVAHSRGGLVARWARARLRAASNNKRRVEVLTIGSPHQGTPIVGQALTRLSTPVGTLNRIAGILRMDTLTDSRGVPISDPLTHASVYLFRGSGLPEGIRSMAPCSDTLGALDDMHGADAFAAIGGECDLADTPQGFMPAFRSGFAREVFAGQPNDLVVGLSSSAVGADPLRVRCSHSAYFGDPAVQDRIKAWLSSP